MAEHEIESDGSTGNFIWLAEAERHIGLKEIPGTQHSSTISGWLSQLGAWWRDDETPWCGVFVARCFKFAGIAIPQHWYRARAWADWGYKLDAPVYGCVVVFGRDGGGHVGFCVGYDSLGRLMILGGNQGNAVSIAPFDRSRVIAYRWPPGTPLRLNPIPLIRTDAASSRNEA
jgi:uncharacterized protein (TIGR02594 family)